MTTLAKRLETERLFLGMTQDVLAEKVGVSQGLIHKLESGKARESRKLSKIAAALGVNTDWLSSGEGEKYLGVKNRLPLSSQPDDNYKRLEVRKIPLIAFDRAGEWREVIKNYQPGGEIEMIYVEEVRGGANTFAVLVKGDAMAPFFQEGELVLIDPDREVIDQNYVLVEIGGSVALRRLCLEAGDWYLNPLNQSYLPKLKGDNKIIGVAIDKRGKRVKLV